MNRLTQIALFFFAYLVGAAVGKLWPDAFVVSVAGAGGALLLLLALLLWWTLERRSLRQREAMRRRSNIIPLRPRDPGDAA